MEEDLRSSGAGLRGFKSHPRHHYVQQENTGVHPWRTLSVFLVDLKSNFWVVFGLVGLVVEIATSLSESFK
jgi:hypothetical protein